MASRGSVIPLFLEQLSTSKEITITDPNMTRFLMYLDDSVDLVMHAFENGSSGDIFVQKAPASTIGDLVAALEDIFDKTFEKKVIGTRHGEKLYETLISRKKWQRLNMGEPESSDNRDLNYASYFSEGEILVFQTKRTIHPTIQNALPSKKQLKFFVH